MRKKTPDKKACPPKKRNGQYCFIFHWTFSVVDGEVVMKYFFIRVLQKTTPFDSHLYVSYRRGEFKRAFFPMEAHPQVRVYSLALSLTALSTITKWPTRFSDFWIVAFNSFLNTHQGNKKNLGNWSGRPRMLAYAVALFWCTLWGDKVSMLTHTYPHKPLRKIKVTKCNHQADSPLYVRPDVWSGDLQV